MDDVYAVCKVADAAAVVKAHADAAAAAGMELHPAKLQILGTTQEELPGDLWQYHVESMTILGNHAEQTGDVMPTLGRQAAAFEAVMGRVEHDVGRILELSRHSLSFQTAQ
eukprot:14865077-Alexandrium_andersonii.AAC.1